MVRLSLEARRLPFTERGRQPGRLPSSGRNEAAWDGAFPALGLMARAPAAGRRQEPNQEQPLASSPVIRSMDDSELARETLRGNTRSFELLVEKYYKVLFNTALRMLGDSEDARDVVQITFMKAYVKLNTFNPELKFFSWIYRIVIHESLNLLGRRKMQEPLGVDLMEPSRDPEEECARSELSGAISAALLRLSPDKRLLVILRHFAGFSYDEMSAILGIPEQKVKSRLYSARRSLGALLVGRSATA